MIIGLGLDVVELPRIKRALERHGHAFAERILHPDELAVLPADPVPYLAARFAAKEAAVKALGTGFSQGIGYKDVYVRKLEGGRPELALAGAALERFRAMGAARAHLSLTHGREIASAVVILESL